MEEAAGRAEGFQRGFARGLHVRWDLLVHVVVRGHMLVHHVHNGIPGHMAGGEEDFSFGVADAVVGGDGAGDILLHKIGGLRRGLEEAAQVLLVFQLPGGHGSHAVVRLDDDGIPGFPDEGQARVQVRHRGAPGAGNARLFVVFLHGQLALVLFDLMGPGPGGDVEVRPQPGIQLQPVLVVALQPVDLPIAPGKVPHGPEDLVIVLQAVHPVVLGQSPLQVRVQEVIGRVPHAQDIDAVLLQADAEPAVGLGEVGGDEDKIHRGFLL